MSKFKVKYTKESMRVMIIEAEDKAEAKRKYEEYDCIDDYEDYGIDETLEEIIKID